jgi:hypothetical protein
VLTSASAPMTAERGGELDGCVCSQAAVFPECAHLRTAATWPSILIESHVAKADTNTVVAEAPCSSWGVLPVCSPRQTDRSLFHGVGSKSDCGKNNLGHRWELVPGKVKLVAV